MNARKLLLLGAAFTATLLVAACRDDDDGTAPGPTTVTGIARQQIRDNTTESAAPIGINDLAAVMADTDDTTEPVPID